MGFVQIVEYTTHRADEIERLLDQWRLDTAGSRTATRAMVCTDRDRPDHHYTIVEFDSYEAARRNSELPATSAMAEQMAKLCDTPPTFHNLDLARVDVG